MSQGRHNVFYFRGAVMKKNKHLIWLCFSFLIRQLFRREAIGPLIHGFLRPCKKHVKSIKIDGILQLENCMGLHDCMYGKTAVRQNKCNFQFLIFDLRTYILTEKICRLIDDVSFSYPFGKKILVIYILILVQKDLWHSVFRKFPSIYHSGFAKALSMSKDHF